MFWFFLALPGVIFAYAVVLRPLLHRIPAFRTFYDEADGFWAKAWALCGKSITVLWGYVLGGIGSSFALFDKLAPLVGAPDIDLQGKVKDALIEYPQITGWALFAISLITIWARVRTIGRSIAPTAADPNG